MKARTPRLRIGISACLLGESVRWDGGDKEERALVRALGRVAELVAVCPEVEAGMGVPREPVILRIGAHTPRMVGRESAHDYTRSMEKFAHRRITELLRAGLDGYVLKSRSPSCGKSGIPIFLDGKIVRRGRGLFASALLERAPGLPVEEETRLRDVKIRARFLARSAAYRRKREVQRQRQVR